MDGSEKQMEGEKWEAPVYYPSEKDFENPLGFIESIRKEAESFGICRIVPPASWKPSFSLDLAQFHFPTRVQSIHQLYKRDAAEQSKDDWWEKYIAFQIAQNKRQRTRNPILGGKELELCRLYSAVEARGGYQEVRKNKLWKDIARCLQVHLSNGNTTYSLRNVYEKYLRDFEEKEMRKTGTMAISVKEEEKDPVPVENTESTNAKKVKQEANKSESGIVSDSPKTKSQRRRKDGRVPSNIEVLMCEHCDGGQFEDCIILCDNCPTHKTKGYHTFCCSPPCEQIPDGNFYCPDCSAKLFARQCFTTGPDTSYEEFEKFAAEFESTYHDGNEATAEELEHEFWRIIETGEKPTNVLYGADLPTATHGSGFPTNRQDPYASHPMNLNNLPRDPLSLLRLIPDDIPGVLVPWLYMGMKFSTFCWHVEDHLFYSINYLHKGAMKKWYGISSSQAQEFEMLLRTDLLKDQFAQQPDLLFHITTMVAPHTLSKNGIRICETLQKEGEFVITFPMAYHGGFNMGLNIAEAVNFAPVHWLEFSNRAAMRYIHHRKPQVLSTEEMLIKAANETDNGFHGKILHDEMTRVVEEESLNRLAFWNQGIIKSTKLTISHGLKAGDEEDASCVICRDFLHISAVVCSKCHRPCCLHHVHQQCECPLSSRTLLYRYSLAELTDIRDKTKPNYDHRDAADEMNIEGKDNGLKRDRDSVVKEYSGWNRFRAFQEDWRRRAEAVLSSADLNLPTMEQLVTESMQFLWAGHEVDDLRHHYLRLKESLEWYGGSKECQNMKNQKLTIEELKRMISKHPAKSNHPALVKLNKIRKHVQDWILKAEKLLHPDQEIEYEDLLKFYKQGSEMNVVLPGLESVKERLLDIQALQRTIESVFRDPSADFPAPLMNLEQLKALQTRASNLKVLFPEKLQLSKFLDDIEEWILKARSVQEQPTCSFEDLLALLEEVGGAFADIPELISLRDRLKRAEDWILEAQIALKECQSHEEMKELLSNGKALDVMISEMSLYETRLHQLEWKDWVMQNSRELMTMDQLQLFIKKGKCYQAENLDLFKELSLKHERIAAIEKRAEELVSMARRYKVGKEKVDYNTLQGIIDDAEECGIALSILDDCKSLYQQAHPISEVFEHNVSMMENGQALKPSDLAPIIAKAESMPFFFSQYSELKRRLSLAEEFMEKTRALLSTGLQIQQLPELKDYLHLGDAFLKKHGFKIAEMDLLLNWDIRLRLEWLIHGLLCDPDVQCYTLPSALGWPLDTVEFSPLTALKDHFPDERWGHGAQWIKRETKPTLEAVAAVLEQAKIANVNFQLYSRLERAYAGAKKWSEYTRETILGQRKLKLVEITNLLKIGQDNVFDLDGVEELNSAMASYAQWTRNVHQILSTLEHTRLPLYEVHKLLEEIHQSPVEPEPDLLNKLKVVVHPGLELKDSFEKIFRYRSLEDLLSTFEKVTQVRETKEPKCSDISGCYCGRQEKDVDDVIYCAKCNDWYHASCIPIFTKTNRRWSCPACKEEMHKPSASMLQNHLNRCQMLKVSLPEEEALEIALSQYNTWHEAIIDKLRAHECSQMVGGDADKKLELSDLSCVWKQGLVIGIDCKDVIDRALSAIRVEKSRLIIRIHLQDGGPTRFDIERCRKEEIPLHIIAKKPQTDVVKCFIEHSPKPEASSSLEEDPLVGLAKRALKAVQMWENECQDLSALLENHAGEPIEQVPAELLRRTHEHIDKATTMKVQVNRDALEHLIFQSTAYCICRQTNDTERPMLACEEEDDCPILWFHYRCVGLNENEAPPPGYKCPLCAARHGEEYRYKLPRGLEMELVQRHGTELASSSFSLSTSGRHCLQIEAANFVQSSNAGLDIAKLFIEAGTQWNSWSEIEQLRVLEHVGECVRQESRRIHEMQQQQQQQQQQKQTNHKQ